MLFGKKFTWYIQPREENRQIPFINDHYTVTERCAAFHRHNAHTSVQIWKYSSLRFGCFLRKSCAECLCVKGFVIVFFCIFIFTVVNGVSKVSKRSKSGNLWTLFFLRILETRILTFPQGIYRNFTIGESW